MLRILPSRPSSVLPCSSRHAFSAQVFPGYEPCACPPFNGARASDVDQFSWSGHFPASPFRGRETVSENRLTYPFRGRETVSRLSYYAIHAAAAYCPLSGRVMHFQFAQYLDLARCNRSVSQLERNRTSLSTMILTYRKWLWLFPTALSNVVTDRGDGIIQSVPVTVWNVPVTLFSLGSIGALQSIQVSMRWHLFFLLFLDTNEAIPTPTSRTAIRTTTLFSRQLTFTPSNDRYPGFFQLA